MSKEHQDFAVFGRGLPQAAAVQALSNQFGRQLQNLQATCQLGPQLWSGQGWQGWLALQQAASEKWQEQLQQNGNEWLDWLQSLQQLPQARTVSRLMEMECNVLLRAGQLAGNQLVNLASLQENIEVNYGYWLSRQLQPCQAE